MYVCKFGITKDEVFGFVIFFAQQCNTTVTIISAMIKICSQDYKRPEKNIRVSLYHELSNVCCELRANESSQPSDVGSGEHPRFSTSCNKIYNEFQLKSSINTLNKLFARFTKNMKKKQTK